MPNESSVFEIIPQGGVTTPQGFIAGAVSTGIKTYGQEPFYDLGVILSNSPCTVAGVFTRNQVKGSSVIHNQNLLKNGHGGKAIFANSGNANVATGEQGFIDTNNIAQLTAKKFNLRPDDVWIASTGVIGRVLPMNQIQTGIESLNLEDNGGNSFAQAIMTTDTRSKEIAIRFLIDEQSYYIGACAKGSGMIHPNLATMLAFITTDIAVDSQWLQQTLEKVVNKTFNMLDIDMDTSTSDTVLILSNGAAENIPINENHEAAPIFCEALEFVTTYLTKELARDGEGAETLIELYVSGASQESDAKSAARTVVSSPLVKTMITGKDPNWGRLIAAIGRSDALVEQDKVSISIEGHLILDQGTPTDINLQVVIDAMYTNELKIHIDLGLGNYSSTAWGCDLTSEYVRINGEYTT
ncbi:MAG: bifunctional glutamate N-acetyltransferase/amino-acid acetyltransferase ArgJ [Dehalococcoidia bacterium]|nr:bifunctional glutamate N-acetyltransferase/amino-acid acetyltransferase ArgJ [Dehalococcoidia bacterium]